MPSDNFFVNPIEQCQAIPLRSGTSYEGPTLEKKSRKNEEPVKDSIDQQASHEPVSKEGQLKRKKKVSE